MKSPHCIFTIALCATALSSNNLVAGTVSNSNDSGSGSLRAAIAAAINGEVIDFAPALNGATITLTSGQLLISGKTVAIDASSLASGFSISGGNLSRILTIDGSSNVTLRNITIRNGQVINQNGGGLLLAEGTLEMFDCSIVNCSATFNGGGINLALGTTATLDRCKFVGNSSSNLGFGGAIYIAGAASTLIRNSVISGNSNPIAGGISVANSSPSIVNCTIQGNSGGGVRCDSNSAPVLVNTIIWDNSAESGTTPQQQLRSLSGSLPSVSNSLVQGAANAASFGVGNPVTWGTGNLDGTLAANNPKFAESIDPANAPHTGGDLRLLVTSSSLNAGSNLANAGILDLARSARIQDSIIDLGAYEGGFTRFVTLYPTLTPNGDENLNGIENLQEYGMGFDPTSTATTSRNAILSTSGNDLLFSCFVRTNALDVFPFWETNNDLGLSWTEMVEGVHYTLSSSTPVTTDRSRVDFRLITNEPRRFYRQSFIIQP